jgi:hypothetical protein
MVQPEEKKTSGRKEGLLAARTLTARCMVIIMQEKVQGKVII